MIKDIFRGYDPEFISTDTDDHGCQQGRFIIPLDVISSDDVKKLGLGAAPEKATHVACDILIEPQWGPCWDYTNRAYYCETVVVTQIDYKEIK